MVLLWLSVGFVAGVAVGTEIPMFGASLVVPAAVLLGAAVLYRGRPIVPYCVVAGALCLGAARSPHNSPLSSTDLARHVGSVVQLHGVVETEPDIRDTGGNYRIAVDGIVTRGRTMPLSGILTVHTTRAVRLEYGDEVSVRGRVAAPAHARYGGGDAAMAFPRLLNLGRRSAGLLGWVVPLRMHLESGIDRWLPEPEAALLVAITLGARTASLGDLAPALVATGLIHLIAISGIKVALVAGTVNQLARSLGNRFVALVASLLTLATYVLITGATVSGERSALMWALIFVASYLGRSSVTLISLSFVAAVMLALEPRLLGDIGFLLSTVGTFAIVAFTQMINRPLQFVPSPFQEALSTTLAAQIGTLPIVIIGFHVVAVTGPITNMLVLPVLTLLIAAGFVVGLSAGVPIIAAPVAHLAYALLHAVSAFSTWAAGLPGAISITWLPWPVTLSYYGVLASGAVAILRRAKWVPEGRWHATLREIILSLVVASGLLTASLVLARTDNRPPLYWLGSGNAMLLQSAGANVLIGGSPRSLEMQQRLGELLRVGERTIDLLIVTDGGATGTSALQDILDRYSVTEVLDVGAEFPSTTYARWRAELRHRRVPAYALRTGASVRLGASRVQAVAPADACPKATDCAGLLRIEMPGHTVFITGSSTVKEQEETIFRSVRLQADVLVCGSGSCSPEFVRAVKPRRIYAEGSARPVKNAIVLSVGESVRIVP